MRELISKAKTLQRLKVNFFDNKDYNNRNNFNSRTSRFSKEKSFGKYCDQFFKNSKINAET